MNVKRRPLSAPIATLAIAFTTRGGRVVVACVCMCVGRGNIVWRFYQTHIVLLYFPQPPYPPHSFAQVFGKGETQAHEEMRQACFDYLAKGGWHAAGPVSLLSGLNPRPSVLVAHFFMVALFGVGRWVGGWRCLPLTVGRVALLEAGRHAGGAV